MRNLILALLFFVSACYLKHYPVTPEIAKAGTYEMFVDAGLGRAQGTAWAVDSHHLITAGHMCENMSESSVLVSTVSGRRIWAHSVMWEKDFTGHNDLCVLETRQELANPLIIADRMPQVGDKVSFVGWPMGQYVESTGKYLGDLDGPDEHLNDDVFSAPCDHGASGSAVFFDRGVWGVLVRVRTDNDTHDGLMPDSENNGMRDGKDGCVAIPLSNLVDFLQEAHINYTLTPEDPPPVCIGGEQLDPLTNTCYRPMD